MKHVKPTITVGIPAHNEGETIGDLLTSILSQTGDFILEKIVIYCDGCTDNTEAIVRSIQDKRISVYHDGKRKGKAYRLNQIYKQNMSDYLATFDGDVLLETAGELSHLLKEMKRNPYTKVVAGNVRLIDTHSSGIERILYYNHMLWAITTQGYRNGKNIHTSHGSAYLFSHAFAKQMKLPSGITCDQGFIYLLAQPKGYSFAHNSSIICNPVSKLSEIQVGYNRTMGERSDIVKHFGTSALTAFKVPFMARARGIARFFLIHPVYTIAAILFNIWIRFASIEDTARHDGLWSISKSVKKKIVVA